MRGVTAALALASLVGCATLTSDSLDRTYGPADPTRHDQPRAPARGEVSYSAQVQPILERRCVVCHGCYDAPCQVKLGAWEGIARGGSASPVYQGERLRAAEPTRLFVDAHKASDWRGKGFYAVLNERAETPQANLAGSLLYRSLALKQQHPLPAGPLLGKDFDVSPDRSNSCPRVEQFEAFERKTPLAGMPYGLPGLSSQEMGTVTRWLAAGAPFEGDLPPTALQARQVQRWEAFLNGATAKERLMSRYLYEHLFLGHLHFEDDPSHRSFRLVRSATPPGQPVQVLATRRPFDDPGVARFWYRLEPEGETRLAKTYMPYALGPSRMDKYRRWFLAPTFTVTGLPSYEAAVGANPFLAFRELPADARYRFLLDEAEFFIMNFIKGPVCRGQMALDVIQDHFWVFFVDPTRGAAELGIDALLRQTDLLRLPVEEGSNSGVLLPWREYANVERSYLKAKSGQLDKVMAEGRTKIDLSLVWNGDGANPNAALTVFRHFDTASVVKGLVGDAPKTSWVIGYPLFERIHYLLVAGYDVYGNVGHQLNSRLYMDFLRMEGEANYLMLLPQGSRRAIAESWYRGAPEEAKDYVYGPTARIDAPSAIDYRSSDPQRELFGLLRRHLGPALDTRLELARVPDVRLRAALQSLSTVQGASLSWLPEVVVLRVERSAGAPQTFTLLRDTGHANVAHLIREKGSLAPEENRLTVVPGLVSAHPNAIYSVAEGNLPALEAAVRGLASEADYRALADRFAIRRTSPAFWAASDALHDAWRAAAPLEAGLLDYNRLENR
jgi:Fatty acid cis/trans isomerase (CTI)